MSDEQDLRDRVREGNVVVIAGAGVSMSATDNQLVDGENVASWIGLLKHGIKHAANQTDEWRETRRSQIALDELAEVGDAITKAMGGRDHGLFGSWLTKTVGALTPTDPVIIEALHALGTPIATTNYDNLIEAVTRLDRVTWQEGSRWQRILRGNEKAVLHLHGHYRTPASVILGVRSYEEIKGDAQAQAMLKALALTSTFLLVGVGAGLDDPNIGALLQWLGETAADSQFPHYRLVREDELTPAQIRADRERRLHPVVYGSSFGELDPFLRGLAPPREPATRGKVARSVELTINRTKVVATASPRNATAEVELELDPHRVSMIQMLEDWLRWRDEPEPGAFNASETREAQLLGRILYDSVIHGEVKRLLDEERTLVKRPGRLSLVLKLENESVASLDADPAVKLTELPWELLYGRDEGWLAFDNKTTLLRALPHPQPRDPMSHDPLRILVVRAQPDDVLAAARKRWLPARTAAYDSALAAITTQFNDLKKHRAVESVDFLETPTLEKVRNALLGNAPPNIVHYIGYDSFNTARQKRCVAMVSPATGNAVWPDSQQFADQFQFASEPPKLVFLHLCEGPREGYPEAGYDFVRASFTELARLLLDRGVQLVVAMQYPMSPDIGQKFTHQFYESIGAGEVASQAVQTARQVAAMFYRLGAPVLYLHGGDEALVLGEEKPEPTHTTTPRYGARTVSPGPVREPSVGEVVPIPTDSGPPRLMGPALHAGVRDAAAMKHGLSRAEFRMMAEIVARRADFGDYGIKAFAQEAERLWTQVAPADTASAVSESALAGASQREAEQNPTGQLTVLWNQLAADLALERPASVGY